MATINDCPYYIEHGDCYDCVYYGDDAGEDCPFEDMGMLMDFLKK